VRESVRECERVRESERERERECERERESERERERESMTHITRIGTTHDNAAPASTRIHLSALLGTRGLEGGAMVFAGDPKVPVGHAPVVTVFCFLFFGDIHTVEVFGRGYAARAIVAGSLRRWLKRWLRHWLRQSLTLAWTLA